MSIFLYVTLATTDEIATLMNKPDRLIPFLEERWTDKEVKGMHLVGQFWHALHFLFTGTAWDGSQPASYLVEGGQTIGDFDVGYDHARFLSNLEVRQFDDFLGGLDERSLLDRFDAKKMNELKIYPFRWEIDDSERLLPYFRDLKRLVKQAEDEDKCIIFALV